MNLTTKRILAVGLPLAVVTATGIAFAAWTANGTGSGTAASGTGQAVSAAGAAVTSNLLYPSGSGDVKLTLSNPNPYPVTVTQINNGTGSIATADATAACDAATGVTFANQAGSWVVPAKVGSTNGSLPVTLAGAASMSNLSDNSCQGKSFTIPVALVAASS